MQTLTIRTREACWVVPESVEIVKLIIAQKELRASDLCFNSRKECQGFTRRLSLLALKDEVLYHTPSIIAELSRRLVKQNSQSK